MGVNASPSEFIGGVERISISGIPPERALNLLSQNGVEFWDIELAETAIRVTLPQADSAKSRELLAKANVSVISKRGALHFARRFKRRWALILGALMFVFALYISNNYIWDFAVEGNRNIPSDVILSALQDCGVGIGSKSDGVEIRRVRTEMLLKLDGLSWISVNVTGGRANVVVRERVNPPDILDKMPSGDIIASKPGLITQLDVMGGTTTLKVGSIVKRGDTIVSGYDSSGKVYPYADITARTWQSVSGVSLTNGVGKAYTGRVKTRNALVFGRTRINLYSEAKDAYTSGSDVAENAVRLKIGSFVLPVSLVINTSREFKGTALETDLEAVIENNKRRLREEAEKLIGSGAIVREGYTPSANESGLLGHYICEAEEDIGLFLAHADS